MRKLTGLRLEIKASLKCEDWCIHTILLNFKMHLYPTKEQERRLEEACEINRVIYNYFILNKFRSRNDMNSALTELKEQQSVLKRCHGKMLQMVSTKVAEAGTNLRFGAGS